MHRQRVALGTLDRPAAIGERELEEVATRIGGARAGLQQVAQAREHGLVQRLLEALLGREQRVDGTRARIGLRGHGPDRDALEALACREALGGLQQPLARRLVVLSGPSHG
jgi:hypothetical protein